MEKVLYSKFSDDRKKKYCIRTDIMEKDAVKYVKKIPLYQEGISHIAYINEIYMLLSQQYKEADITFNKCQLKSDAIYLEYIESKTLQSCMEEYIDTNNDVAIETILYRYIDVIQKNCKGQKFVKTDAFVEVFGDLNLPNESMSLEISDIDLIFSNIMVGEKWEVIDYEWTFTFPIPLKYIIYRAFYLAHHQMRRCSVLELENLMRIANISQEEQDVFAQMEKNFQQFITGGKTPFRDVLLSSDKRRTTLGEEFQKRDQEIHKRDNEIIKRDNEIIKRDNEIIKLIDLHEQDDQTLLNMKEELDTCKRESIELIQKKDEQILQLVAEIEEIKETKWWKARTALLKILGK